MAVLIDRVGSVFGRLTVIARGPNTAKGGARWLTRCECGAEKVVSAALLRGGLTKSCGCYRRETTAKARTTHGYCVGFAKTPEYQLWWNAKVRAKRDGLGFDLAVADIIIPSTCPMLGIPLATGSRTGLDNSPSIDRLDNSIGYVKGNVWVVSHRANRIKGDATFDELRRIVDALRIRTVVG